MGRDSRRLRLLLVLLLLTSFTLITLDIRAGKSGAFRGVRNAVHAVVGPVEDALASVWRPIGNGISSVVHIGRDRRTAQRLEKENATLRDELRTKAISAATRTELGRLFSLGARGGYRMVPAQVIAYGNAMGFEWTVTIDAGRRDGISRNMTVVNADGLVGRVTWVGPWTSTVLLAIDPSSTVGSRLEDSGQLGKVDGNGESPLQFTLFSTTQSIKAGERVVTFGSQGDAPFVPGVPIGTVSRVVGSTGGLTRQALVTPFVDFTALDVVGVVVVKPRTDPRDSVLLPKPTPAPSPTPTPTPTPTPGVPASATPTPTPTRKG